MDVIKIGKFIADCRKSKELTQEELAEKLYITDRAVSKWERGLSLPDADKMLDLCNILDINVNELLLGEKIDMKNNDKKTEELLLEMARQEEYKNKQLLINMWVLGFTAAIAYIAIEVLAATTLGEGVPFGIITVIATAIFVCVMFYDLKLEIDAGYYECKKCHHRFVPKYKEVFLSMHMGTTRYLKCPECGKRSWAKKRMTRE